MVKLNCVETALRACYTKYAKFLSRHPLIVILISLVIAGSLGTGFMFFSFETDTEYLFTPLSSQATEEKYVVQTLFPVDYDNVLPNRLIEASQRQISIIVTSTDGESILREDQLEAILALDSAIQNTTVSIENGTTYQYYQLCGMWQNQCIDNDVLTYYVEMKNETASEVTFPYPYAVLPNGNVLMMEPYLGGAQHNGDEYVTAKALRISYLLRHTPNDYYMISGDWEDIIGEKIKNFDSNFIYAALYSSDALDEAQRDLTRDIVPYFTVTYTLLITFAIMSCIMFRDNVQSKPWLGSMGVLSSSLAVVSTIGLLSYAGVAFNQVVTSVPFLTLGLGLDDMFIMISAWRIHIPTEKKETVNNLVKTRMAATYSEAAVSITITSITDILAFCIGAISPLPAIRTFCLFAAIAILFDFVFQISFFGSCMVLFGRREHQNRHSMTCMKVSENNVNNSNFYNACCSGGGTKVNHLIMTFFKKHFTNFLSHTAVKFGVMLTYFCYLGVSIYGCTIIEQGLQLKHLAADGSQTYIYLDLDSQYYTEFGPSVSVNIEQSFPYWDISYSDNLDDLVNAFQDSHFVQPQNYTECWFKAYQLYLYQTYGRIVFNEEPYLEKLRNNFLILPQYEKYNLDINFDKDGISSSRFILSTHHQESGKEESEMMVSLRNIADEHSKILDIPIDVFAPAFVFFEQYLIIVPIAIQTLCIAMVCMLVVSFIFIPNVLVSLLVSLSVASIITGVLGFMTIWDVSLDAISVINLVLCVGFSVDFSAHIAYVFVSTMDKSHDKPHKKLSDALYVTGYPILQSGISTILGVCILFFTESYIFQTFAKIIVLVMVFGMLHGLLFLPVIMLSVTICKNNDDDNTVSDGSGRDNLGVALKNENETNKTENQGTSPNEMTLEEKSHTPQKIPMTNCD